MPEAVTPSPAHRGLAQQGYYELSSDELDRLDFGLRFTPAVMMVAAAIGLATQQPFLHAVLTVIGVLTFLMPAHHPLDLLYNLTLRRLLATPALPPNPLPRRLAMLVAAAMNLTICFAFTAGRTGLAWGVGAALIAMQLVLVSRHLCLVSWILDKVVRASNRPQRVLTGEEARQLVADGALLVDVRSPREFANGHLPGAVNVPIDEFERHVDELLEQHRPLVLYCAAGVRCNKAATLLEQAGGESVHQLGTMRRWSEPA